MRLAFVLHHYFPHGGLQRDALRIASACLAAGHQIEFLTMAWNGSTLPKTTVKLFPQNKWCHYQRDQAFSAAVLTHIHAHPYDAVVGFNKMAGLDIYYVADYCFAADLEKRPWQVLYKLLPRYRHMLQAEEAVAGPQKNTHLFFISPATLTDFRHFYHTSAERLHFLTPGIARDRCWHRDAAILRTKMRAQLSIASEKKLILMLGSAFKTKGVDRGIRALAALPSALRNNTELLIVGQGNKKPLVKLARQLQVESQVTFILGSDEVPALLFSADLLLHPAYKENTGTAILEAIVAGLPVLTTANCGYAFYVEEAQAGLVLPEPFAQDQLNEKLAQMLTANEYPQWQQNAIRFGQTQDVYSLPEKTVQLMEKIIRKSH